MQLGEAEAFGVLDDHDRRFGHVDPDFDHGRGHQDAGAAGGEILHRLVALRRLHLAVDKADLVTEDLRKRPGPIGRRRQIHGFRFLDHRADPIDPRARRERPFQGGRHLGEAAQRDRPRVYGRAARRLLGDARDLHVAINGKAEGPRDRRRRHHQHVHCADALGRQHHALMHAEAVLLVDHGEQEVLERDVVLDHRMGADQDIDFARRQILQDLLPPLALVAPRQQHQPDAGGLGERRKGRRMLPRQNFRRRQQRAPARRPRPRPAWRGKRRSSCRCRHRPARAAASDAARPDRRGFHRTRPAERP